MAGATLALPVSASAAAPTPAPESISGTGIVAATHYSISATAGPYGENPSGTLSLTGFFGFDATLTCINEGGQDGVAGFRIDTGPLAGMGFLSASQASNGIGDGAILYSGTLPTPPTACPPPGTPPPELANQGGGGTVQGTLGHTGGPDHPVPFQQLTFSTPATPGAVSQASNGPLWFVEPGANRIASAPDDESGQITEYAAPAPSAGVSAISADLTGGAWFTESQADAVGHIDASGTVTETALPAGARPSAISATTGGGAWVTEPRAKLVALIDRSGHVRKAPTAGTPTAVAAVPGKDFAWVTDASASGIVLAGPGVNRFFPTPTPSSRPTEIVSDGAGGAWFIESAAGQLGHIGGSGPITEYPLPADDGAVPGLAAGPGPDGSTGGAWFSEPSLGRIAFISAGGAVDEFTLPGAVPGELAVSPTLQADPLTGYDGSEAVWWTDGANGQLGLARFPLGPAASLTSTAPVPVFGAVSVAAPRSVTVRRSVIALTVRCAGLVSCSGDATLRHQVRRPHAPPVLASRSFRIRAGRSTVLRLALNGRGRGLVAAARRAGLSAGLTVRWSSYGHQLVRLMTLHPVSRRARRGR